MVKVGDNFVSLDDTFSMEHDNTSRTKENDREKSMMRAINYQTVRQLSPRSFQEILRSKHIVIVDYNLSHVGCDRPGIMSLNSLKEIVNIEGMNFLGFFFLLRRKERKDGLS